MNFAEIKWPEVSKKRLIHQVVIDAEVKGVLARLRWRFVTNPVKTIRDNFDWLILVRAAGRVLSLYLGTYF
jgi:hypothetical protein